jgi:two-component system sensor histidine kinase/response regulator
LTDIHGEEAVISWSRVKHPLLFKYGIVWIVAVDANRAEVFAPLNKLLQQGGIVLSILAALLIFLTYVSSGIFAKPIRSLHHAIEQVGKGDLYCRVAMDTNDEIGELSEAFDQMTRNLRESTTSIANLNREMAERQKVEEALRQNQEKFKSLFDYTNDAIFIAEVETRKLVDCNRTAQELIGYPKERILSMYADQLHPEDRIEETMAGFRKQAAGEIEYVESEILTKDQKRIPVSISSAPVVVGGKTFLQGIFRDVTEQRQAGAALRKAKQEAEAASRAKGEFLANVSHEIRTPMNAIIGMTELTLSTNLTKEQREYVETIKMSSESLLGLLNDVLDLSKIEAHQMDLEEVNFDLRTTVESVAETLAVKAEETGLEFTCHIKPDVPTALVGDPLRLGQILVNLCGNAIKFTEAGEVVIHVETEKGGDDSVVLHFTVSDTGIGIPRDKVETIFESFRQADGSTTRKYGGTGLGLAVCKELVGKMGGNIWVESPANCQMPNAKCQMQGEEREQAPQSKIQNPKSKIPGPGSTFHFTAHFGLNHAKIKEDRLPDRLDLAGMPVLIVDDNATNRLVLREITSAWGLLPAEAVDGNEALVKMKKAFESGNPYRLLLIDVQMPGMDGFELTKRVKESPYGTDAEIILLTSLGQKVGAARCKELGISGYLVKPVKQSELLDAVMMALGESPVEEDSVIARSTIHPANRRLNILLAEDNLVNQKVAVAMLKKRGHRIVTVLNGKAAVEQLDKDQFDLILMDVQMPEMDGIAATREIRNSKSDIRELPIVAMTANAMKGDQEDYLRAGMNDYISKPIKPEELFRVVESWGDRQHGKKEEKLSVVLENQEQQARNVFDLTKALEVTAGDTGLFQEIANLFIEGLPGNIAQIREGISRGDSAAVERGAHSLKGSVSNFGAERAFKAAYDLELVGRKAKLSEAEVTFLELNSALKELEGAIRQSLLEMEHESSNR